MQKVRAHLFIEGQVQGVFYRAFTRNTALRLGLNGWAKNLFDGRVEVVFEGTRELIEEAISSCRKGPPGSQVVDIHVSWENYSGDVKGFEIRY